jgi:UDP-N-acetylmuramoylalanine--D-glutamate ligase
MSNLNLKDKRVAILGLGIEGIATTKFLQDDGQVKEVTLLDQLSELEIIQNINESERAEAKTLLEKYELISGNGYLDNLERFDIIFRSPGISIKNSKLQEAIKNGVVVSSQIRLFFELCPAMIIGVTGTKGKGTTASLIHEILVGSGEYGMGNENSTPSSKPDVYLAGNIGYPAITLIPKLKNNDLVVLELSSFQLMDLNRSPHIAVVTNLSVDHLNYHEDVNEYQTAKINILKFQTPKDFAVLNSDSTFDSNVLSNEIKSKIKYFSHTEVRDAIVKDDKVILDPSNRSITICDKSSIKLFGRHNLENIAAASIVADILQIDLDKVEEIVEKFRGLPHRLELVREVNGVRFINDSFATNPEPTIAALDSFSENKIIILGGSSKGADFTGLADKIVNSKTTGVVLIGLEGEKIKNSLLAKGFSGRLIDGGNTMKEIVASANKLAEPNDVILFSPACASFDMFKNYKDRGEKFKTAVLGLHI